MSIHHVSRWLSLIALALVGGLGAPDLRAAEVARWDFDANLEDQILTSDLTSQGGVAITTAAAPARRQGTGALLLDGFDDYASTADAPALDVTTSGLTISTWIYSSDFANSGVPRIIEKGVDSEYRIIVIANTLQFEIFNVGSVSAALPSPDAWHHVVAVWDPSATPASGSVLNGVMYLYVDGVQVAFSDTIPGPGNAGALPLTSTGGLTIGGKFGGSDFFKGTIDDVRLFNAPLNLAAIKALVPAASALAFSTQPTGATAGAAFTTQPVVHTVDDNGYDSTVGLGATVNVTITREDGTGSFIGSPTTVINVGTGGTLGVATYSALRLDLAGSKSLLASATLPVVGAVTTESQAFSVGFDAAAKLGFLQQPTTTVAGAEVTPDVTVQVLDAYDNVVTTSTATIAVAIGTNPGTSTLGGDVSEAAVSGVATFGDLTLNKVGTGYTLTAASSGLTGATSSAFNITIAAAAKLAFLQNPTATVAGAEITPDVTVCVLDAFDNVVTGSTATISVAIGTNPGTSTLGGDVSEAAVSGMATFGDLTLNKVGTGYTLTAASSGLTGATSSAFNITVAAAAKLAFLQNPATTVAGAEITPDVTVRVLDAFDNVVTGSTATINVAIGTNPGTSTLGGDVSEAAVSGVATFGDLTLNKVGTGYTLTAASSGLTGATSSAFAITFGTATQVAFTQEPTNAVAGAAIAPAVTVSVLDVNGNVVTSSTATIDVAIGTNPGTSTLGGTASVAAVAGVATFNDLTLNKVGTGYTLTASSGILSGDTSVAFDITPDAANHVAITAQPGDTAAGQPVGTVTVEVRDQFDNLVTGSIATVTASIAVNPGGSTLGGTTSVAAVAGVATFSDLTLNKVGTGYILAMNSSGFPVHTSAAFNITPGTATQVAFVQDPTTAVAGAAIAPAVTVSIQDANGNVVTSSTATIDLVIGTNPGSATLGGTASVAAVAGVATFSDLTPNKVGTGYTLTATSGVLTDDTSATFDITVAGGSQLVFATQPVDSVAGAVIPLVVEIQDAFGNPTAATDAITIAIGTNPGGGTLSGTVTVSATAGSATFTDLSINRTGSAYTLVASVSGFSDLISSTFSITPDVAHGLAFTVDPTDAVAGAAQAGNVEVEIIDQHGNRVTSATNTVGLAFGANPGSATLGGTTSLAAVAGLAVFPGLTVSAAGNDYTLVASAGSLATDTSATFDISAASGGGSGGGGGGSSSGGCGLGSAAPFAALMLMLLMMARLRSGRRSDHHV